MADALPVDSEGLAALETFAAAPAEIEGIAVVIVAGSVMKKVVLAKGEKVPAVSASPAAGAFAVTHYNCAKGYPPWGLHSHFHS